MSSLLSWVHSCFSVHAEHRISAGDSAGMEKMARYATRAPMRLDAVQIFPEGNVQVQTPRNHRTGATFIVLEPLDSNHNVVSQIPDPRSHLVRYYGAYSNCGRRSFQAEALVGQGKSDEHHDLSLGEKRSRASWARLLRKIVEPDPLLCQKCEVTMKVVSVITEPEFIDRIMRHRERAEVEDIFEPRAPPSAPAH